MSATTQLPMHPWASAHRVLLTALAFALALAVAITIALVISRTTGEDTGARGGTVNTNPSNSVFPQEHCTGEICAR